MSKLGELKRYLGVELEDTPRVFMSQQKYTEEMLQEFGPQDCKPASTPLPEGLKVDDEVNSEPTNAEEYRRIVGKYLYLTNTRTNLAYLVGVINRYMGTPKETHLSMAKHILRYVRGTKSFGIIYLRGGQSKLQSFTDADWACDIGDRKSTVGYIFKLGEGPVAWASKKQPTMALSSTEAEYRVLTEGAKEATWLKLLLNGLGFPPKRPITIHCDNMSNMNIAKNPVFHSQTKHIEVHYHYVWEKILS